MPKPLLAFVLRKKISVQAVIQCVVLAFFLSANTAQAVKAETPILRVGTEGAYAPFNYYDEKGNLAGFDVDIALALCREMEMRCNFFANDWETIIDGLEKKRYDVIIASMSITEDRKQRVLFTDKYYSNALRFIAPKTMAQFSGNPTDARNQTIGVQKGTLAATYLLQKYTAHARIRQYDNQEEAFREMAVGKLNLVLVDALPAYDWLQTLDGRCCQFASPPIYADEGIGMAVRLGEEDLRDRLNAAFKAIREKGIYDEINAKYFPFSIY